MEPCGTKNLIMVENAILPSHLHLLPQLRVTPLEFHQELWPGKTRVHNVPVALIRF